MVTDEPFLGSTELPYFFPPIQYFRHFCQIGVGVFHFGKSGDVITLFYGQPFSYIFLFYAVHFCAVIRRILLRDPLHTYRSIMVISAYLGHRCFYDRSIRSDYDMQGALNIKSAHGILIRESELAP
jgi:hypothetical protein